jgi:hypothetical protein
VFDLSISSQANPTECIIERHTRTKRSEWLSQYIFETIEEAQDQATEWL